MLNARRGIRGRGLMPASSSCTAATATADANAVDSADRRRIMNPLCAARRAPRTGAFLSRGRALFFFLPPLAARRRLLVARIALSLSFSLSARRRVVHFYYSRRLVCSLDSVERARVQHLMKCHRCPTDCRGVKCRRLLIPRLFLPVAQRARDFDFARRNAAEMTARDAIKLPSR